MRLDILGQFPRELDGLRSLHRAQSGSRMTVQRRQGDASLGQYSLRTNGLRRVAPRGETQLALQTYDGLVDGPDARPMVLVPTQSTPTGLPDGQKATRHGDQ